MQRKPLPLLLLLLLLQLISQARVSATSYSDLLLAASATSHQNIHQAPSAGIGLQVPQLLAAHLNADQLKSAVTAAAVNLSTSCRRDALHWLGALQMRQSWAIQFADSWGKPAAGVLAGAINWLGSFDQCMLAAPASNSNATFKGQYCALKLKPATANSSSPSPLVVQFTLGVCWPSTCTSSDVEVIFTVLLQTLFKLSSLKQSLFVARGGTSCKLPVSELPLTGAAIAMITVLSIIGCLLIIGTVLDLFLEARAKNRQFPASSAAAAAGDAAAAADGSDAASHDGELDASVSDAAHLVPDFGSRQQEPAIAQKLLLSFSIRQNASRVFSLSASANTLGCVHGIRFISMTWIVLGHSYLYGVMNVANLGQLGPQWLNDWTFQAVLNATVAVDTFFVLSGLLTAYLFNCELQNQYGRLKQINWIMFYLHRYWRLTPAYMLLLATYATLSGYVNNGPLYPQPPAAGFDQKCSSNWWKNLLYIQNLFDPITEICMPWSWFLANDMQFHAISPLFLIPLSLLPAAGVAATLAAVLASVMAIGFRSTAVGAAAGGFSDINVLYIKPWFRIGPYLIGLLAGLLIYRLHKSVQFKPRWYLRLIWWCTAAALCCSVLYGLYNVQRGQVHLQQWTASLYNCLFRVTWSVGVAMVTVACITGNGGWVNDFLSHKLFLPLSRLSYCLYLVHPAVMLIVTASRRDSVHWDTLSVMYFYFGNLLLSLAVAIAATLAIEAPMISIEKVVRRL